MNMIVMSSIILSLVGLLLTGFFVIRNLLKKLEKAEEITLILDEENERYWEFIVLMQRTAQDTQTRMEMIDRRGGFKNDDETGVVFNRIKEAVDQLNGFINGGSETEAEEEKK